MSKDELLFTADVAARCGVTVRTVNRWVREGKLTPVAQAPGPRGARMFNAADLTAEGQS
jgi:DNA-binding transcriptional MerR regulator